MPRQSGSRIQFGRASRAAAADTSQFSNATPHYLGNTTTRNNNTNLDTTTRNNNTNLDSIIQVPEEHPGDAHSEHCGRSEKLAEGQTNSERAESPLRSQATVVWDAHRAGKCRPCSFFRARLDGCRLGMACSYCHFCTPAEATRRRTQINTARRRKQAFHP